MVLRRNPRILAASLTSLLQSILNSSLDHRCPIDRIIGGAFFMRGTQILNKSVDDNRKAMYIASIPRARH